MGRFIFKKADYSDNDAIQKILETNTLGSNVRVAFRRGPDYFKAAKIEGFIHHPLVVKDSTANKIIAFGYWAIKPAYVNGKICDLGYLGCLRINNDYQKGTLLARIYNYVRENNQDKNIIFVTFIAEDNKQAIKILTSKKGGIPFYYDIGAYYFLAIDLGRKKNKIQADCKIIRGSKEWLYEIIECLNRNGAQKQFYPYYKTEDFMSGGIFSEFDLKDFSIAIKNNKVVGVIARWDLRHVKQIIFSDYSGKFQLFRMVYNLIGKGLGFSPLPKENSELSIFYASFIAVDFNDKHIFQMLLRELYNDSVGKGYSHFLLGLHSKDPFLGAIKEYHYLNCKTRMYVVCWDKTEYIYESLDERTPYLEIATV